MFPSASIHRCIGLCNTRRHLDSDHFQIQALIIHPDILTLRDAPVRNDLSQWKSGNWENTICKAEKTL
jgi:hypothetical protein